MEPLTTARALPPVRLGVNIDHVATLRNARGGGHPSPLRAARLCVEAGADGITAHLREDRRHILDADIFALREQLRAPLNFEMAATLEMQTLALKILPHACCLVPERRAELTTEGGLDVLAQFDFLRSYTQALQAAGIRVSLFIDANPQQVLAAQKIGADCVEFHTGGWCHAVAPDIAAAALNKLEDALVQADALGLECHAGHGLDFDTARRLAQLPMLREVNIGHFLMGEALFSGLPACIAKMRAALDAGRLEAIKNQAA